MLLMIREFMTQPEYWADAEDWQGMFKEEEVLKYRANIIEWIIRLS